MKSTCRCAVVLLVLCVVAVTSRTRAADKPATEPVVFEKGVLPIFQAKCVSCHGPDKQKAGLDVRSVAALLKGGETGPSVAPGSFERSELWVRIASDKMPPGKDKLTETEKVAIRAWIETGAKSTTPVSQAAVDTSDRQVTDEDRNFWSFKKPVRPAVPGLGSLALPARQRVRNPIDAFVLTELDKKQLTMSPEADRLTLLRRAYHDLLGMPPSAKDVESALNDKSDEWYERVVDRLLASSHYGERWGRHWLDLAGYADSEGILDADYVRTAAWRYRDYVIRAFNSDKPFDRFLKEQIAGDELVDYPTAYKTQKVFSPEVVDALVATGYLRCASDTSRPDFVNIKNAPGYYYQTLDDTVKIVASSTLGLTMECAKCHSHKYDPIPQTDYYRVQAVFMSGYRPYQWVPQVQRRLLEATEAQEKEAKEHNGKVDAAVAPMKKQLEALKTQFGEQLFKERLAKLPDAIREDVRVALTIEPAKRSEVQKYLADKFQKELRPDANALAKLLPATYADFKTKSEAIDAAIKVEDAKRITFPEIRALYDLPGEAKTHLLRRGDYLNPGTEVKPGALAALMTSKPFQWTPKTEPAGNAAAVNSGRRLAFAEWLTQPDHPLTARVLVNRLWLHHFGEGIVNTPDNFGRTGARPSHPELLDWLATEFVARGWSIKAMHKLIMTSSAYRQVSAVHADGKRIDPDNRLLWRQRLRRLEAESLRDSILSVAGNLNAEMFGPPVPMQRVNGEVVVPSNAAGWRRSVYLQVRRSQPLTLLQVFDQPVMETNCTRRGVSTVASQALSLMNSDFLVQQSEALATRVLRESAAQPLDHAVRLTFTRAITEQERTRLTAFFTAQTVVHESLLSAGKPVTAEQKQQAQHKALADLCHMLFSANEFAYVD